MEKVYNARMMNPGYLTGLTDLEGLKGLTKQQYFVALHEGSVVGCVKVSENWQDNKKCRLESMAVDEKLRCRAIGCRMLHRALEYAKECGYTVIELTTGNPRARDFYEKHNFRVVFTKPVNPPCTLTGVERWDPVDFVMSLELQS